MIPKITPTNPEINQPVPRDQASNVVENEGVIASQGNQAVEIQKLTLIIDINHTEGTSARPANSFSHADLPQSKFVSMAQPLSLGVDSKIKAKSGRISMWNCTACCLQK